MRKKDVLSMKDYSMINIIIILDAYLCRDINIII